MKYLIVDDESLILRDEARVISKVLEEKAEIMLADNYVDALKIAEQIKPYVAFLDVDMPEMDGIEVGHKLRKRNIDYKIIMLYYLLFYLFLELYLFFEVSFLLFHKFLEYNQEYF